VGVFVPIPNGVQVELVCSLGGGVAVNRLWFTYDNPPFDALALQGLVEGVTTWHLSMILPALSQDLVLQLVRGSSWDDPFPTLTYTVFPTAAGGSLSGSHSANVAVVVPFIWPFDYRLKRNKNYVPGIPVDQVALNTVQPGLQNALFEGYAALVDAARLFDPVRNWRWVAASAYAGGAVRAVQFTATIQGPPLDTPFRLGQRRRRLP
jgi:hypothetical protein